MSFRPKPKEGHLTMKELKGIMENRDVSDLPESQLIAEIQRRGYSVQTKSKTFEK